MRPELQHIMYIEDYLLGNLNEVESNEFKKKIDTNSMLSLEVETQLLLQNRIKKMALRKEISLVHKHYIQWHKFSLKNLSLNSITYAFIILSLGSFLLIKNLNFTDKSKKQLAPISSKKDTLYSDQELPKTTITKNPKELSPVTNSTNHIIKTDYDTVFLKGRMINGENCQFPIQIHDKSTMIYEQIAYIETDNDGYFETPIITDCPKEATVFLYTNSTNYEYEYWYRYSFKVFLQPGKQISINCSLKKRRYQSLEFSEDDLVDKYSNFFKLRINSGVIASINTSTTDLIYKEIEKQYFDCSKIIDSLDRYSNLSNLEIRYLKNYVNRLIFQNIFPAEHFGIKVEQFSHLIDDNFLNDTIYLISSPSNYFSLNTKYNLKKQISVKKYFEFAQSNITNPELRTFYQGDFARRRVWINLDDQKYILDYFETNAPNNRTVQAFENRFGYLNNFNQDSLPKIIGFNSNHIPIKFENIKNKTVIIHIWSTNSKRCINHYYQVEKFMEKFKENNDFLYIMVTWQNDVEKWKNFLSDKKKYNNLIHLYFPGNQDSKIAKKYQTESIPSLILIDKTGKTVCKKGIELLDENIVSTNIMITNAEY